jgi:hypothetical protein
MSMRGKGKGWPESLKIEVVRRYNSGESVADLVELTGRAEFRAAHDLPAGNGASAPTIYAWLNKPELVEAANALEVEAEVAGAPPEPARGPGAEDEGPGDIYDHLPALGAERVDALTPVGLAVVAETYAGLADWGDVSPGELHEIDDLMGWPRGTVEAEFARAEGSVLLQQVRRAAAMQGSRTRQAARAGLQGWQAARDLAGMRRLELKGRTAGRMANRSDEELGKMAGEA